MERQPWSGNRFELLQAMCEPLAHRGPDDSGVYLEQGAALGMRRLSIIDVEGGHQPMQDASQSLCIVHNGEVYNSPALRRELEAQGWVFRTRSDTEVILNAYAQWGPACLGHLRGMFAFAIWDRRREELFLARDPFGIKPLFYAELPDSFIFGSELKALLQFPGFPRMMDHEAFLLYLLLTYIPAPRTIWKHAHRLPPGHFLRVREGRVVQCQRYFFLQPEPWKGTAVEAVDALHSALQESVRLHLLADVPVGAFLSGGLDSSLVTALAQEALGKPIRTFTVVFPEFPTFDESGYAQRAADHLGTQHEVIPMSAADAQSTIPQILDHLDEPFADASLVPSAVLSRFTRSRTKVALGGDGGDELFAGYNKYLGLNLAYRLAFLSPLLQGIARLPFSESRATSSGNRWRRFRKLAWIANQNPLESAIRAMEVFRPEVMGGLLSNGHPDVPTGSSADSVESRFHRGSSTESGHPRQSRETLDRVGGRSRLASSLGQLFDEAHCLGLAGLNKLLYADAHFVLPYDMLHKVDTASMRYSLEVRVPLVDPQLARLAFSFPADWKLHRGRGKWILRRVAARYFPEWILDRPKAGLDIPLGEWLGKELWPMFQGVLSQAKVAGYFQPAAVDRLLNEHLHRQHDHFPALWSLFVFEWWRQRWRPLV